MLNQLRVRWLGFITALAILLAACSPADYAETPFARQASDAASALSAAATTIDDLHHGKLDERYAKPSVGVYRNLVRKIAPTLPDQRGAPDEAKLRPVLDALDAAEQVLDDPCLGDDCDWQAQVDALRAAEDALLEAAE
jgi:hypothetical protein